MSSISSRQFLLWKKKQLLKGGDNQSLSLLLECVGGISNEDNNLLAINSEKKVFLKKDLYFLESIWDNHLFNNVPIQHLSGYAFWRDLKLKVSEKVLIPRPETEQIIDIVCEIYKGHFGELVFAELGTGSGAISIALTVANPLWKGIATDIDENAIDVASKNLQNYSDQSNLKFLCGKWWEPLKNFKCKLLQID